MFLRVLFDGFRRVLQIFGDPYDSLPGSPKGLGKINRRDAITSIFCLFSPPQEIRPVVINPLLIANFAKRSLRKTKTDKRAPLSEVPID